MSVKRLVVLSTLGLLFGIAGCKGDKKADTPKAAPPKASKTPTAAKPAAKTPTAAKPAPKAAPLDAAAFFKDYFTLKGMALMDKYGKGVTVTGSVTRTITEMDKNFKVVLSAGDKNWLSLAFKDKGVAAKAKGAKAGSKLTAKCQIGGGMKTYILLNRCELL
jgi:hypothetical protein